MRFTILALVSPVFFIGLPPLAEADQYDRAAAEASELAKTDERAAAEGLLTDTLGPEFLDALAVIAPDSREELTGTFILMVSDQENAGIYTGLSIEILTSVLSRNAVHAMSAEDEDLKALIKMQTRLAEGLLPDKGLCAAFLARGFPALADAPSKKRAAFRILAHLMRTLERGSRSGIKPREATGADWRELVLGWHEAGATREDVEIWTSNDPSDRRFCDVALSFQRYFMSAEGDAAEITRAEIVRLTAERYGQEY